MRIRDLFGTLLFVLWVATTIQQAVSPAPHRRVMIGGIHRSAVHAPTFHPSRAFDFLARVLPHWQTRPPEPVKRIPPQRPYDPKNPAGIPDGFEMFRQDRPHIYRTAMMMWQREVNRKITEVRKSLRAAQASSDYIYFGKGDAWQNLTTSPSLSGLPLDSCLSTGCAGR